MNTEVRLDHIRIPGYVKGRRSGNIVSFIKKDMKVNVGMLENNNIVTITLYYKVGTEHSVELCHRFLAQGEDISVVIDRDTIKAIVGSLEDHAISLHSKFKLDKKQEVTKV